LFKIKCAAAVTAAVLIGFGAVHPAVVAADDVPVVTEHNDAAQAPADHDDHDVSSEPALVADDAAALYLHAALLAGTVDDERYRAIRAAFFAEEPMPGHLFADDHMSHVIKQMRSSVSQAATRSNCSWQRDNSNGPHVLLPDIRSLRRAANIILAHARWRSQEGDHSAATADIVALVALGRHQQRDLALDGCLSGLANELAALRAALQLAHTLNDAQRQELAIALEKLPRVTDIGRVVDSERANWAWIRKHGVATLKWPVRDDKHLEACVSAAEAYFDQIEPALKLPTAEALRRLTAIQNDIPVPTRSVLYEVLPTFSGLLELRQRAVDMTAATIAYLRREELPSTSECTVEVDRRSMTLTWRWPYPGPTGRTETDTIDLLHWSGPKAPREDSGADGS
jgi:hypothetical protein